MKIDNKVPSKGYGITKQINSASALEQAVEKMQNLGYVIIDSGYTTEQVENISKEFDLTRRCYVETHGESPLRNINEFYTIRSPLTHGGDVFLQLALNENLLSLLQMLISGKFILNQQNGIINPPQETYNQSEWHRDLPYQHFISSRPLAINALYCIDDFTVDNGATFVLPASHKLEAFPSWDYVRENAIQIEAKAGSYILLDCMMFHAGGYNSTNSVRRAVNHLYNIPFFKQQINIPINMKNGNSHLTDKAKEILGFNNPEHTSIPQYFLTRTSTKY